MCMRYLLIPFGVHESISEKTFMDWWAYLEFGTVYGIIKG